MGLFLPQYNMTSDLCCADTCPVNFSSTLTGFAQIVSPHIAATVTLKMTAPGVVVFTSAGPGHCQAGVLVNVVVSQGTACRVDIADILKQ